VDVWAKSTVDWDDIQKMPAYECSAQKRMNIDPKLETEDNNALHIFATLDYLKNMKRCPLPFGV